ncbi:hypothetical protein ACLH0K_00320 [Arthrobacter sp. MPF02]|uniref:hypothetical protein n=1 Tax=Arthrobacter sp. MPF02 TaxID=3388492 RepID=UPI0039849C0B
MTTQLTGNDPVAARNVIFYDPLVQQKTERRHGQPQAPKLTRAIRQKHSERDNPGTTRDQALNLVKDDLAKLAVNRER